MTPARARQLAEARVRRANPAKAALVDSVAIEDGVLTERSTGRLLDADEAIAWELTRKKLQTAIEAEAARLREEKKPR